MMRNSVLISTVLVSLAVVIPTALLAQARSTEPDSAMRVLVRDFSAHWARSDAAGISRLFTDDADVVIPTGTVASGVAQIRDFYQGVFASGYAGSTTGATIARVRQLTPELAIVDATWIISGASNGGSAASSPERGILTAVIRHVDKTWKIAALREQSSAVDFVPMPRP